MIIKSQEYLKELVEAIPEVVKFDPRIDHWQEEPKTVEEVLAYVEHNIERFVAVIKWLKPEMPKKAKKLLEAGSWFPFVGYYFWAANEGLEVQSCCIDAKNWSSEEGNLFHRQRNLCTRWYQEQLAKMKLDVLICTETLEHLPCNLVPVVQAFEQALKKGGKLLLSVPQGGKAWKADIAKEIDTTYPTDRYNEHVRVFVDGELKRFVGRHCPGLKFLKQANVPGEPVTQMVMWEKIE